VSYRAAKFFLLGLLRSASWLVPRQSRNDWLAEWKAELLYVFMKRVDVNGHAWSGVFRSASFCLGSFVDAFWLGFGELRSEGLSARFNSPLGCLLLLSALMAVCCSACYVNHGVSSSTLYDAPNQRLGSFALQVLMALIVLPVTTSFSLGDYSVEKSADLPKVARCYRTFLLAKVSLVMAVAYTGALGLTRLAEWFTMFRGWPSIYRWIWDSPVPVQSLATVIISLVGLRWALRDQWQRCPVCLRLLSSPASVGHPSRIFLAWSGTETICRRGHGLLHVPDVSTSWFHAQRWLSFDSSWRQLFPLNGSIPKASAPQDRNHFT
jgi:hypothetical protein